MVCDSLDMIFLTIGAMFELNKLYTWIDFVKVLMSFEYSHVCCALCNLLNEVAIQMTQIKFEIVQISIFLSVDLYFSHKITQINLILFRSEFSCQLIYIFLSVTCVRAQILLSSCTDRKWN